MQILTVGKSATQRIRRYLQQAGWPIDFASFSTQGCEDGAPTRKQLWCMDEGLKASTQIRSDCREPPALHSEEDVTIATLVQAADSGSDQGRAETSSPMLLFNHQIAQLSATREIETRRFRIVDGANGYDPGR